MFLPVPAFDIDVKNHRVCQNRIILSKIWKFKEGKNTPCMERIIEIP